MENKATAKMSSSQHDNGSDGSNGSSSNGSKDATGLSKAGPRLPAGAIANYLRRRETDLATCRAALEAGDLATIGRIGHQIRGNGTTFGFADLSELGERMETAGLGADAAGSRACVEEFERWLLARSTPTSNPS